MTSSLTSSSPSPSPSPLSPVVRGTRKRRRNSSGLFVFSERDTGSDVSAKSSLEVAAAVAADGRRVSIRGGTSSGGGDVGGGGGGGGGGRRRGTSSGVEATVTSANEASSSELYRETLPELGGLAERRRHRCNRRPCNEERCIFSSRREDDWPSPPRPPVKMGDQDQEELDYYIVFPSFPAATTTTSTERKINDEEDEEPSPVVGRDHREEFVFVYEEDKRPVVVLLGWAGCQDKYLAKYSAIYEEKSCITLRYTAPVECLFWRRDRMPNIGRRLVQVIAERSLDEHPIFFHVFSNGGAFLYQHVSLAIQQSSNPIKVKGVIFDSAPGERRVTALFKAISAILGGHPMTNIPISFFITVFLSMLWLYEVIAHAWGKGYPVQTNPIALAEEVHSWPQLFLYSNADTLIPAMDVEKFASRRAERGVRVQLVLFTDSPHVKHYAMYRDVYVNTVCTFIHECLTKSSSVTTRASKIAGGGPAPSKPRILGDEASIFYETAPGLTKRVVLTHEASKALI